MPLLPRLPPIECGLFQKNSRMPVSASAHLEVPLLHQGRNPDRARNLLVRFCSAQPHGEAGRLGCSKPVVGLVVSTGYVFNTDTVPNPTDLDLSRCRPAPDLG
jgi:hypothetical protein